MTAAWLGATEFHRFTDGREPSPILPGLTLKGVNEVCNKQYKAVHVTAPPDWQGQPQAPRFTQIKTDYDKSERVPIDMTYLLEDEKPERHRPQRPERAGRRVLQPSRRLDGQEQLLQKQSPQLQRLSGLPGRPEENADQLGRHCPAPGLGIVNPFQHGGFFDNLELYKKNGKFANRNLLLAGPPGTGKSMINDILMQELEGKELAVQAAIEGNSFAEGKHVLLKAEHFEKALETIRLKKRLPGADQWPPLPKNPERLTAAPLRRAQHE